MSGTIVERLRGRTRIGIDTATIIYFIERHSIYLQVVRPLFQLVDRGMIQGVCSYVTLLEVLVKPLRDGRPDLVREYQAVLLGTQSFSFVPVDRDVAERGAEFRAKYRHLRTPDAIQLATASLRGAQAFVTNDAKLRGFDRVEVLLLSDFVSGAA